VHTWDTWKLRALLLSGLFFLLLDYLTDNIMDLGIPRGLDLYLVIASFYFTLDPQRRIEKRMEEWLLFLLFPGAFATVLLPLYTLLLFMLRRGW
jgi:hypothetical protein